MNDGFHSNGFIIQSKEREMFFPILQLSLQTAVFMVKEILTETSITDKLIYVLSIYHLSMILYMTMQYQQLIAKQQQEIESLRKQISHAMKIERMREEMEEIQNQEFKTYCQDTSKQIVSMEKKIKHLEQELLR